MKRIVINSDDIIYNINLIHRFCGEKKIIAVIKGNGYGLGLIPLAKLLIENGIEFLAVSDINDAMELRNAGIECEILLLASTSIEKEAEMIAKNNITATVGSLASAEVLNRAGIKCKAHIKVETGFGRYGFLLPEEVKVFENIKYTGIYSHFSDAFGKKDKHTKIQLERFNQFVKELSQRGINPELKHISNSCAAVRFDFTDLDAVRVGSALTGRISVTNSFRQVGVFENEISEIKILPKGHNVGYANTFKTARETKIAIVGGGYGDGLFAEKINDAVRFIDILRYMHADLKQYRKKITVNVNGKAVKVIGRIGMCNIVLDVTDINAEVGDTVRINCNPLLIDSSIPRIFS